MCIYVYIHTYTYIYIYIYLSLSLSLSLSIYLYIYIYIYIFTLAASCSGKVTIRMFSRRLQNRDLPIVRGFHELFVFIRKALPSIVRGLFLL